MAVPTRSLKADLGDFGNAQAWDAQAEDVEQEDASLLPVDEPAPAVANPFDAFEADAEPIAATRAPAASIFDQFDDDEPAPNAPERPTPFVNEAFRVLWEDKLGHEASKKDAADKSMGRQFLEGVVDPQQYGEFFKGIAPGAVRFGGTAAKGVASIQHSSVFAGQQDQIKQLSILDLVDRGEDVPSDAGFDIEIAAYQRMTPEQRAEYKENLLAQATSERTPLEERTMFQTGKVLTDYAKELFPAAKDYNDAVGRQLGEGIGSLLAGLPAGFLGRVPALAFFGSAGSGEAVERALAYHEADKKAGGKGLTEQQIITAALWGVGPGSTDLLPVEILLGRLKIPQPFRGPIARSIGRIGGQAFVEGIQEGGQEFLQNLIAQQIYNDKQELGQGVLQGAGIGAGVGGIAEVGRQLIARFAGRRSGGQTRELTPEEEIRAVAEAIDQGQQVNRAAKGDQLDVAAPEMEAAPVPSEPSQALDDALAEPTVEDAPAVAPAPAPAAPEAAVEPDATVEPTAQPIAPEELQAAEQDFIIPEIQAMDEEIGAATFSDAYAKLSNDEKAELIERSSRQGEDVADLLEEFAIRNEDVAGVAAMAVRHGLTDEQITQVRQLIQQNAPDLATGFDELVSLLPKRGGARAAGGGRARSTAQFTGDQLARISELEDRITSVASQQELGKAIDTLTKSVSASDWKALGQTLTGKTYPSGKAARDAIMQQVSDRLLLDERVQQVQRQFEPQQGRRETLFDRAERVFSTKRGSRPVRQEVPEAVSAPVTPERRQSFANVLNSRVPRSKWAEQLGVTDAEMQPLIEEAIEKGFLRRDRNGVIRRVPKSQRAGSFAAMAIPDGLPDSLPGDGNVAFTPEAADQKTEMTRAVNRAAMKILPEAVSIDVVDNITIAKLRKEDELLALREDAEIARSIPQPVITDEMQERATSYLNPKTQFIETLPPRSRRAIRGAYGIPARPRKSTEVYTYHATNVSTEFQRFDPEVRGRGDIANVVYLTDHNQIADYYADPDETMRRHIPFRRDIERPRVFPVYLDTEGFAVIEADGQPIDDLENYQDLMDQGYKGVVIRNVLDVSGPSVDGKQPYAIQNQYATWTKGTVRSALVEDQMFALRKTEADPSAPVADASQIESRIQEITNEVIRLQRLAIPKAEDTVNLEALRQERKQLIAQWEGLPLEARAAKDQMLALRAPAIRAIQQFPKKMREFFSREKPPANEPLTPTEVKAYHGTSETFTKFDKSRSAEGAVYFASRPDTAEGFIDSARPGQIMPVFVETRKFKTIQSPGHWSANVAEIAKAKKEGYKGLVIKDVPDETGYSGNFDEIITWTKGTARSSLAGDQMLALRGFYSPAIRAAENISQAKGTGEQFWKQITKVPGVRKDELEWMGLEEFLADKKSITKDEVLSFMRAHQVELDEKVLGQTVAGTESTATPSNFQDFKNWLGDGVFDATVVDPNGEFLRVDGADGRSAYVVPTPDTDGTPRWSIVDELGTDINDSISLSEAEHIATGYLAAGDASQGTRFQGYKVPGGENYRELLIRLPELGEPQDAAARQNIAADQARFDELVETDPMTGREIVDPANREEVDRLRTQINEGILSGGETPRYTSPHFQDQEIVHLRVDDRTGPNGEKVLFINEVQSDLHQTGRKKGYQSGAPKLDEINVSKEADGYLVASAEGWGSRIYQQGEAGGQLTTVKTPEDARRRFLETIERQLQPDAPFKGDLWLELALKRALLYASENGYDAVSWARSDQIAKAVGADPESLALQYDQKIGKFLSKYTKKWGGKVESERFITDVDPLPEVNKFTESTGENPILSITPAMRSSVMEGQPLALRGGITQQELKAAKALQEFAKTDEAFVYPRSEKADIVAILNDVAAGPEGFEHQSTNELGFHEHGAKSVYNFLTSERKPFHVYEDDNRVWIDVSEVKQGQAGSAIYAAVANYALNTGRKFIGDPDGMTPIALRRRTENMLSSALKFGTTDHLEPHEDQRTGNEKLGVPPLQWTEGDTFANIASLMEVSVESVASKFPEIKDYRYDLATGTIRTGEGQPVSLDELAEIAETSAEVRASRAGSRTLARVILQNTLLQEAREGTGSGLLGEIISRSAQSNQPGAMPQGIFYAQSRQAEALGRTDPYNMVISIAMKAVEAEARSKGVSTEQEAIRVLRHEAVEFFHALGIIDPKEWQLLQRTARKQGWVESTGVRQAYESVYKDGMTDAQMSDLLVKEAIAEQYSEFHLNRKQFKGKAAELFQRIKDFIDRVANFMRGEGFQTWDDVFTRIDQGEFKQRFNEAFPELAPQQEVETGARAMQATAGRLADSPARQASAGIEQPSQSLADIIGNFNRALGLTVRQGRLDPGLTRAAGRAGNQVRGQTSMASGVVRMRVPNEIDTLAHEGGHALENRFQGALEAVKRQHSAELTPLASPGPDSLSEGFAEWFRRYVTNPAAAQRVAPNFTAAFEQFIGANDPAMLSSLQGIQGGYQEWINAPSGGAVASSIVTTVPPGSTREAVREFKQEGLKNTFFNWIDRIYTVVFDDLHPIRMTVDGLMKIAEKSFKLKKGDKLGIKTANNPYKLLRLARDGYAAGHMDLLYGVHGYKDTAARGPSLREAIAKAFGGTDKAQWSEENSINFGAYLASRRMVQEWARFRNGDITAPPDKFSLADHQQAIRDFESAHPDFATAAQQVYAFQQNMLKKKLDAGLITQELYDELSQRNDYVPVMRDMSDRGSVEGRAGGRTDKYSVISRFRGSQRDVINPLESIAKDAYETAMIIARNDAIKALDALARAAGPDGGAFAERIPAHEMKATQVNVQEALKAAAKSAGVDPADMQIMLQAVDDQIGDNAVAQIWRAGEVSEKGEAIVYLWENGQRIPIRLADGKFGHDMLHAVTGLNREAADWWVNILSLPSTGLRIGVTASADFIGANFLRDQVSAWVLTQDFIPFYDGARGIYNDLSLSDVSRIYSRAGGIMGGANVAAQHESRIKREILQLRRKGIRFTLNPMTRDFWRMTEFSETGTRLAVFERSFERAQKDGLSDWEATLEAAYTARDYIDFGRRGSRMLAARRLIPFFNAALQGVDRGIRGMRGKIDADHVVRDAISPYIKSRTGQPLSIVERQNKKQATQVWGYMAALGMFGLALSLLYKDDEEHEEISDYMKATHWMFRVGEQWVRIPKPFELAFFSNLVERTFDYVHKDDPTAVKRFIDGLYHITAPPHSIPGIAVTTELMADHNFFTGRPLVGPFLKNLPPELQFNAYASEFGKYLGKQIGVSPAYIDHFITGFGASYGREFVNASDHILPAIGQATGGALGLPTGPVAEAGPQDTFFIRRFTTDPARGSLSVRQFWDQMSMENGKFVHAANGYKHLIDKVRDPKGAQELLDRLPDEEKAYALLMTGNSGGRSKYRKLHPLNRAKEIVSIAGGIKKEINLNRLYANPGKASEKQIELTPQQMRTATELLSDITMRETRNSLIALKMRGWAQKKPLEVDTVYAELKAAVPEVHAEMVKRLDGKKLPSYETVVKAWPIAKERILEAGQKAIVSDLYLRDYSIGRGESAPLQ